MPATDSRRVDEVIAAAFVEPSGAASPGTGEWPLLNP